jgi:hypothetical protein
MTANGGRPIPSGTAGIVTAAIASVARQAATIDRLSMAFHHRQCLLMAQSGRSQARMVRSLYASIRCSAGRHGVHVLLCYFANAMAEEPLRTAVIVTLKCSYRLVMPMIASAIRRSTVVNPSLKRSYTDVSKCFASRVRLCRFHRRDRLAAVRNSQAIADCDAAS